VNGEDYVSLSRMLGRNAAYIQQFIRRRTPCKLDAEDRRTLARYLRIDEAFTGRAARDRHCQAAAAPGRRLCSHSPAGRRRVRGPRMRKTRPLVSSSSMPGRCVLGDAGMLSMIEVSGDSMEPPLGDGDDILVDRGDAAKRVRNGIYVLRFDDALNVKRIAMNPERTAVYRLQRQCRLSVMARPRPRADRHYRARGLARATGTVSRLLLRQRLDLCQIDTCHGRL
jgi:hypothetical protein